MQTTASSSCRAWRKYKLHAADDGLAYDVMYSKRHSLRHCKRHRIVGQSVTRGPKWVQGFVWESRGLEHLSITVSLIIRYIEGVGVYKRCIEGVAVYKCKGLKD